MNKTDLIVVTGAGGFIAGSLVRRFKDNGFTNIRAVDKKPIDQWYQTTEGVENVADCDLMEKDNCYKVAEGAVEVYQLAADMGGMGFIETNKAECMLSVLINTHMLMAARDVGKVERYFYSSSACAYNTTLQKDATVTALKESDAYPAMAEDGYGWEKLFTERMCRHFMRGLRHPDPRLPDSTTSTARTAPGTAAAKRRPPPSAARSSRPSTPTAARSRSGATASRPASSCTSTTAPKGIDMITHSDIVEPINLGSSELISINQLVDFAEEIAGVKLKRNYKLDAPKGVRGRNSDNTLIKKVFGWEPSTPFKEGLAKTYEWIKPQYEARKAGGKVVE